MIVSDPHMPHGERTKLLDFGIAKFTGSEDQSSTRTQISAVMGSPSYMSPEQCRGAGQVDDRTDVYALGCMLYEMLCGRPPFIGESLAEVMGKHQFEPPLPLGKRTAGVPPALLALIDRLLIKDKAKRPAMSQLLEGLETLREQQPQVMQRRSARFPLLRPPPEAAGLRHISTLGSSVGQGLRRLQQTPRALVIVAAGLLTLAALAPLLLDSRRSAAPSSRGAPLKVSPPPSRSPVPAVAVPAATPPAPPPVAPPPAPAELTPEPVSDPSPPPRSRHGGSHHHVSSKPHKHRHTKPTE